MRPRLLATVLLLYALPCHAQEPAAAIVGPAKPVPGGSAVVLDASKSASAFELQWKVEPATPLLSVDKPPQRFAFLPQPAEGEYLVTVTALGLSADGKTPLGTSSTIRVVVGKPAPAPDVVPPSPAPTPTPAPLPAPAGKFQELGRSYGADLVKTYVETMEETATMVAAGSTRADVNATFNARWDARRRTKYAPIAAEFARIAPDNVEPTGPARDSMLAAWQDFVAGLKEAIR